jgi:hypothetical protein
LDTGAAAVSGGGEFLAISGVATENWRWPPLEAARTDMPEEWIPAGLRAFDKAFASS